MATRTRQQRNGTLETAMAMLINIQATFVNNQAILEKQYIEAVDRSEKRFDEIMSVLARHERILQNLPETIRQKIGFKGE